MANSMNGLWAVMKGSSVRYKDHEVSPSQGSGRKQKSNGKIAKQTASNVTLGLNGASSAVQDNIFHEFSEQRRQLEATERFTLYLKSQRGTHYETAEPLQGEQLKMMQGYFSSAVLGKFRVRQLLNERLTNPWFYPIARKNGLNNLPELPHMAAATFLDVIVFNEKVTPRDLFHGLVHATQIHVLGVNQFSSLFVRGFLQARSYFLVPLKAHAFSLDARFASNPDKPFSVEDEVRAWWKDGRYFT